MYVLMYQKGTYTSYKYVKTLCRQSKGCKYVKVFAILLLNSTPQIFRLLKARQCSKNKISYSHKPKKFIDY